MPGSRLMYGSSLVMVTLRPRDSRMAASEEAAMPLPNDDTTPPVIKIYFVMIKIEILEEGRMQGSF